MDIIRYRAGDPPQTLKSDPAAEYPLYLCLLNGGKELCYSKSLTALLKGELPPDKRRVSTESLSFLLQNGVIPPPRTIYHNLFILSVGDTVKVETVNGSVYLSFEHNFPFRRPNTASEGSKPNYDDILDKLANAVVSRMKSGQPTFLFHSAGKDSNSIVLALAEAGLQDAVTLVSHKSKGLADESEVSARIAKRLGFEHKLLYESDVLTELQTDAIEQSFARMPFPCIDSVELAYPLYALQLPELRGANIIDGGGNDSYMGTPPTSRDRSKFRASRFTSRFSILRAVAYSEGYLAALLKTAPEWCGMHGLSFRDSRAIFPQSRSVYSYWDQQRRLRDRWSYLDLKTDFLTSVTAAEVHIRKVRNFTDSISANLILPWANESVVECILKLDDSFLIDRAGNKSKVFLRTLLQDRLSLDSDAIGKMGYSYDFRTVILKNWSWVDSQVLRCALWDKANVGRIVARLKRLASGSHARAEVASKMLYRILMISLWWNQHEYPLMPTDNYDGQQTNLRTL